MSRDRRALYVFGTLAVCQALDVLTTKAALALGGSEANPTARPYVHLHTGYLLGFKVLPVVLFGGLWVILARIHERNTRRRLSSAYYLPFLATIGVYAYTITNNLSVIRHLGGF